MKPTIKQLKAYIESITPEGKKLSEETIKAIRSIYESDKTKPKSNK